MPVFALSDNDIQFPDPSYAEPDGLLALGGDLSPQRLLAAYCMGIFPWYAEESPILWWSPDPRCVLFVEEYHQPRSLTKELRRGTFHCTFDTAFDEVIRHCSKAREDGTWLVPEMVAAYSRLHALGVAHSIEAWVGDKLAGGLYGISLGHAFFGESMFFSQPNASKVALAHLVAFARQHNFLFIDCQQETENLLRFGARGIPREQFLALLAEALQEPTLKGRWSGHGCLVP